MSMASYRDENCLQTLLGAYSNSANPKVRALSYADVQTNVVLVGLVAQFFVSW